MQADNFTITSEHRVQPKQSQLDAISSAKRNGSWVTQGGQKNDPELSIQDANGNTVIAGQGYTITESSQGPVMAFAETWEWDGTAWRVVSLRYSVAQN
ncbi:conserved hypothetical protein [Halomonas sp. A3H3]|uniref:hypothetical protein n=1 Tax=Halomonadaceae TaxID=28256 RepID=UPI00038D85B4|nr:MULTISPECIES: hypothetical protein [Halomonas]CDG54958.1 conserved hypothetical protein [Halomonas sp. A3H3]